MIEEQYSDAPRRDEIRAIAETLLPMIDQHGIAAVLEAVAMICNDKAKTCRGDLALLWSRYEAASRRAARIPIREP